jgi:hypothetical protein
MIKCKKFLHGKKNLKGSSTWQKRNKNHWTIPFIFFLFSDLLLLSSFSSPSWLVPILFAMIFDTFRWFSIPIFRCIVWFLLRSQLSFPYLFSRCSIILFSCPCSFSVFLHSHSIWSTDRSVLKKGHSGLLTPSILGPSWVALVYPVLFCRRPISFLSSRCFRSSGGYLLVGWYILV